MNHTAYRSFALRAWQMFSENHIPDIWFLRLTAVRFLEANQMIPQTLFPEDFHKTSAALKTICEELAVSMPFLFDNAALAELLPLEHCDFIGQLKSFVPAEEWLQNTDSLGRLYEYYRTEERDRVLGNIRKKQRISDREIPDATRYYTPEWIVKFLVENAVGRMMDVPCREQWQFFLKTEALPVPAICPEHLKLLDPCMGAGHILQETFSVLMQRMTEKGWNPEDAAIHILQNCLYGLELDETAYRLACFSLTAKAALYAPSLLRKRIAMHLACFPEFPGRGLGALLPADAVPEGTAKEILSGCYDIVLTNPPFLNGSSIPAVHRAYLKSAFPDCRMDMAVCFVQRCQELTAPMGCYGMLTPQNWMFLAGFQSFRETLLRQKIILCTVLTGAGAFYGNDGQLVKAAAFLHWNSHHGKISGAWMRTAEKKINAEMAEEFRNAEIFRVNQNAFSRLSWSPFVYWASPAVLRIFEEGKPLSGYADTCQGMATGNNRQFLRYWFEVEKGRMKLDAASAKEAQDSGKKWFPYSKGGEYRKWYGCHTFVINWEHDGREIKAYPGAVIRSEKRFFQSGFTWSLISENGTAFRFRPGGQIFDVAGMGGFSGTHSLFLLGLCNSCVGEALLRVITQTMNLQCGDLNRLPVILPDTETLAEIETLVQRCIETAKEDWDSFEASWDFSTHPLTQCKNLHDSWKLWQAQCEQRYDRMQALERQLNRIFLSVYGMESELSPEPERITVRLADMQRDVRSFLSYAVGCIFGRYPSDVPTAEYLTCTTENSGITERITEFLRISMGEENLVENLHFIGEALGGAGTAEERIADYFAEEFFKDHVKQYHRHPIYWMFSSGRKKGFRCLVYLHTFCQRTLTDVYSCLKRQTAYHQKQLLAMPEKRGYDKYRQRRIAQLAECIRYERVFRKTAASPLSIDRDADAAENYKTLSDLLSPM